MSSPQQPRRPLRVLFVASCAWLSALISALFGLALLTGLYRTGITPDLAHKLGWFELSWAALTALVALGLARGNRLARLLTSVLMTASLASALWGITALWGTHGIWGSVLTGAFATLILVLLWGRRSRAYFE